MSFSSVPGVLLAKLVVKMPQGEKGIRQNAKDKKERNENVLEKEKGAHILVRRCSGH